MRLPSFTIRALALNTAALGGVAAALLALAPVAPAPAEGDATQAKMPAPPASGVMGFVVDTFVPPIVPGMDSCPGGPSLKLREHFLASLPEAERARLSLGENDAEMVRRWQAQAFGPNGTNICSQPDMFERPLLKTVQSPNGWGLDLDEGAKDADTCTHEEFTTPAVEPGIDNQEYRALGCKPELRGNDGNGGDQLVGTRQFLTSGEWTQVILLRGVDSLENDPEVEVIYGNTPDRPMVDSAGKFLPGASFTISDKAPRHRNVLKGRIERGVLTTQSADILLAQTWGQGGARDIRGNRSRFTFRKGRLRLTFQPDGSLLGMVGGYRPIFEEIQSPALGGVGSATVAGIDCAGELATLKKLADGIRDPKTGQCTAVSGAMRLNAIPAFVNDVRTPAGASAR